MKVIVTLETKSDEIGKEKTFTVESHESYKYRVYIRSAKGVLEIDGTELIDAIKRCTS